MFVVQLVAYGRESREDGFTSHQECVYSHGWSRRVEDEVGWGFRAEWKIPRLPKRGILSITGGHCDKLIGPDSPRKRCDRDVTYTIVECAMAAGDASPPDLHVVVRETLLYQL